MFKSNRASGRTVPGDIVVRFSRELPTRSFYNITVVKSLTDQAVFQASSDLGPVQGFKKVLNGAYSKKVNKHGADVESVGGRFVPLVVTTTGVWHPEFLRELRAFFRYASIRQGEPEEVSWKQLLARLGCALEKGNEAVLNAARSAFHAGAGQDREEGEGGPNTGGTLDDQFFSEF